MLSTHVAFGCLGLSSWVLITGIYSVVASYAEILPEGYDISVYLVCSQCLSNVIPGILQVWLELKDIKMIQRLIWANLLVGVVVCCLLAQVSRLMQTNFKLQVHFHLILHHITSFFCSFGIIQ